LNFIIDSLVEVLKHTPKALHSLLYDVSKCWSHSNEGGDTWSPYDVIGHLIHCDEYNWIPRIEVLLSDAKVRQFEPLDRFAQLEKNREKNVNQLLDEFVKVRFASLEKLAALNITESQLLKTAIHPELGLVTLSQLISTWVVHDLDHVSQIARVMAKQYKAEIGPWIKFMKILNQ
jgi:hypothetical protein